MSQLGEILKELSIPKEKMEELVNTMNVNPMAAMSLVTQLQIPPEVLQKLMATVMSNPGAVREFAEELGMSQGAIDSVENQVKGFTGQNPVE